MENELDHIIEGIDFENIGKHPNILIAARMWDDRRYRAAEICYTFMRMIDDLVDDRKAREEAITCLEKEQLTEQVNNWMQCLISEPGSDPFLRELTETIDVFKIPLQLFKNFARSMIFDLHHDGFDTFQDFLDYSEGASVAPASIFVHLCCLQEINGEYQVPHIDVIECARPCALYSYIVHIIRDFQADQMSNLNYFARDILQKYELEPDDLKIIARKNEIPDSFRKMIKEYRSFALDYEIKTSIEIEKLSPILGGRYLMSLHLVFQLYKMVFDRIDPVNGSFTGEALNPTPSEIREKVLEVYNLV